ncbi:MAG: 50S ribosomal protein P1 [Candidatus Woesearchaeota archaeon]
MEYIYAAMLLHKSGQQVNEAALAKVLDASGIKADPAKAKAVVAALQGVDIDAAIKEAAIVAQPAAQAPSAAPKKEDKRPAEEEKKSEDQAAAGLGALFG